MEKPTAPKPLDPQFDLWLSLRDDEERAPFSDQPAIDWKEDK